jgi:acetoin utilization deacetylase AcuC-like enzyme
MSTAYLYSPTFLEHAEPFHVEAPDRLSTIMRVLDETRLHERLTALEPVRARDEQILAVHTPRHLEKIRALAARGGHLDLDTYMNPRSLDAAYLAAGGAIRAVDAVMQGEVNYAFSLARPPGHHATRGQAMGFCLFNNLAIAACHALNHYKLERVMIVDFDVHHGNGTQDIFYDTSRVLYFSSHRYPFYPGTGHWSDMGEDEGVGFTVNVPLPFGVGDVTFQRIADDVVYPLAERYQPQLLLVSAGYDAHWADPLGAMTLVSTAGFATMVRTLKNIADDFCHARMVLTLEGGYHLDALAYSVAATFAALLGETEIRDPVGAAPMPERDAGDLIEQLRGVHRLV